MASDLDILRDYHHLARYALWAYDNSSGHQFRSHVPEGELDGRPLDARKVQISTWTSHSHVHLGIRGNNTLVMAFRGTDFPMNLQNWQKSEQLAGLVVNSLTDTCCDLTHPSWIQDPYVLVHEGFLRDFDGLVAALSRNIARLFKNRPLLNIETCGHSLGGALATLCALWCSIQYPGARITCLSLASPRVGNDDFARHFASRDGITCYRLVIPSDWIPQLPNETTEKIPVRYTRKTRYFVDWKGFSSTQRWTHVGREVRLYPWWVKARKKALLAPHDPLGYLEMVQTMRESPEGSL